uniref:Uncharacterized protein n=1 Tax=Ciona savignyi TaxID=51511 RepID=H2Z648_CIOSA
MDPYPGSRFRRSEMNYPQQPPPMPSTLSARSSGQAYQGNDRQSWQAATTSQREPYAKSFREGFYPNQRKQEPDSMSWQHKEKAGLPEVPAEVKKLMTNFNLSPADLQKLSQMPENQISLSNLARVIGDLKQQKESPRKEQPKPMPNTR